MQADREAADISDIIRQLHGIVDETIHTRASAGEGAGVYDISKIDFERLRLEFAKSPAKHTAVQGLKDVIEKRLNILLMKNPLRTDFQAHYDKLVDEYNLEKDRLTSEMTFEALLKLVDELSAEERRAMEEGLDEETLALFDLLSKPQLSKGDTTKIKKVAAELLDTLKAERLRIENWREKESTRDAVKQKIYDFLYDDSTGLPVDEYNEDEIKILAENIFRHVYRAYPTVPSPIYGH